jgi:hypothetical protein
LIANPYSSRARTICALAKWKNKIRKVESKIQYPFLWKLSEEPVIQTQSPYTFLFVFH